MSRAASYTAGDLRGAQLFGEELYGLDLRGQDLGGAGFTECTIRDSRLQGLANAEFNNCSVSGSSLDLDGASGCRWIECTFDGCEIRHYARPPSRLRAPGFRTVRRIKGISFAILKGAFRGVSGIGGMGRAAGRAAKSGRDLATRPMVRRSMWVLGLLLGIAVLAGLWMLFRPDMEEMSLEALELRAANLSASGRPSAAAEIYQYIIDERAPREDAGKYMLRLGGSFVEAGRIDEAIAAYEQVLASGSASPEVYLQVGALIETSRGGDQAAAWYGEKSRVVLDPAVREVLTNQLTRLKAQYGSSP